MGCLYSVAFGWPTPAYAMCTIFAASSGQYHTRPPPVTSYCHCSRGFPLTTLVPKACLRCVTRSGLGSRLRGDLERCSHISSLRPGATVHRSSQPVAAGLSAKTRAHSPWRGGGAARSPRFGTTRPGRGRTTNRSASAGQRAGKFGRQFRVRIYLCGCFPISDHFGKAGHVANRSTSFQGG